MTISEDGHASLKQVQRLAVPQLVCNSGRLRMAPRGDVPPEWRSKQSYGWSDGACEMVGTAEFDNPATLSLEVKLHQER